MEAKSSAKKTKSTKGDRPIEEEEATIRSITVNLSEYPEWVRNFQDDKLEKVFKIGVLAMESMKMTVSSDQKHLEQALASQLDIQMKPIHESMDDFTKSTIEQAQKIQKEATTSNSTNLDKVLGEVVKVQQSVLALAKPSAKGALGEMTVLNILKTGLPVSFTTEDVSKEGKTGDLRVTTPTEEKFFIEVKNHATPVAKQEIERFEQEVADNSQTKVGIMLSLRSGIARRSTRGKFEISPVKNKYVIFVPNALAEENIIVWSVMLANELAQMNVELKDTQKKKLSNIYDMFNSNIEKEKQCRRHLETLKTTVENLQEDMVPILDMVKKSKGEVNKILHS